MFAGKKSAQIREILISESAWEEMTCLFAPSLISNHSCGASDLVASETRTKRLHENGRLLCIRREHTESSSLLQQALSLRKTSPTIKYFGLIPGEH
ncbi:hypothetical protein DMJ49_12215 [Salmonella enterica]|nr:hypothetical protein [Salmonella enterica]EBZ5490902.1 hypothetical protein [Salmonella enterica subsp. enterica serovar Senftenberg]EBP2463644.1 hypothetical protein [Salmonella enterica]ECH8518102.1 hypothetical protein [Salmonella enterica subsp. enterica serovar Senftenberg]ECO1467547.1 hypothetical protein [Salmonella enterica subsp. enterica serovar Senftenberg]